MPTDHELATQIAAISSLSYPNALAALEAGGRPRELALELLKAQRQHGEEQEQLAEAKEKLQKLTAA